MLENKALSYRGANSRVSDEKAWGKFRFKTDRKSRCIYLDGWRPNGESLMSRNGVDLRAESDVAVVTHTRNEWPNPFSSCNYILSSQPMDVFYNEWFQVFTKNKGLFHSFIRLYGILRKWIKRLFLLLETNFAVLIWDLILTEILLQHVRNHSPPRLPVPCSS